MNNFKIRASALLLALVLLTGVFTACKEQPEGTTTETTESVTETTESATANTGRIPDGTETTDKSEDESHESETGEEKGSEGDSSYTEETFTGDATETASAAAETDGETEESVEVTTLPIDGEFASSIVEADRLAGKVNAYFESVVRDKLIVTNDDVTFDLGLSPDSGGVISSVKGKDGNAFLENTMAGYIKTEDGRVYYTTNSTQGIDNNIYRLGYYMYDVHVYGNDFFVDETEYVSRYPIAISSFKNNVGDGQRVQPEDENAFAYKVTSTADPRAYLDTKFPAAKIKYVRFSMKTTVSQSGQLFVLTDGDNGSYSVDRSVSFEITPDGEFHEYVIRIGSLPGYTGSITGLRFDVGSAVDQVVEIKDVVAFNVEGDVPNARFDRSLYVYSDKINQVMHIINPYDSYEVQEYGWEIRVPKERVAKLIVEDRQGEHHDTLERIHWGSASYIGFDIRDVGVFGFIMINDERCGNVKVALEDGDYVIRQYEFCNGGILSKGTDLYLGHRLYFRDTHSFDELKNEAYCERNPLTDISVIQEGYSPIGRFNSYDGLRGAYKYDVRYGNWSNIYNNARNKHYNLKTTIKGDDIDRRIYVYTSAVGNGQTLECAVLMDRDNVLIPLPLEVCKNFKGDGEENEFLKDIGYSEVYFPLVVKANEEYTFTVSHLYHNWGKFPLKQIDSIQFYTPFYHLSCGVTETNCLRPYYECNEIKSTHNIYALPDHRAMSAPLWPEFKGTKDPQHTNGGFHNFLEYIGESGYVTTEFVNDHITSYGPTYAEIVMDYVTDDGKIKVSYTHMEMPQTDENRGFYTCTYEFLEDLTVADARKNFSFYSVAGRYVDYGNLGYLDENNEPQVVDNTLKGEAQYLLGDEAPYFDCFKWVGGNAETENDYVNVACLISDYSVEMGGESFDGGLMLYVQNGWVHLTLNADTLEFRKGDKISLNMIVIPWGSQKSDYEREDPDWNIREVRENTLLDPITVEVIDGERVESVYLPTLKTVNGRSAEFTLSGGENNISVEVRGFDSIARPKVFEKINGEWVAYELSSKDTPDAQGNAHDYDGYMVKYEGGDTFSYSFVVDMNGDCERTFKIVVE